jgi:hypothetical protein
MARAMVSVLAAFKAYLMRIDSPHVQVLDPANPAFLPFLPFGSMDLGRGTLFNFCARNQSEHDFANAYP